MRIIGLGVDLAEIEQGAPTLDELRTQLVRFRDEAGEQSAEAFVGWLGG